MECQGKGQEQQEPGQLIALPKHVPLRQITYQALLRSLGAEHDALQKIHVRIQQQLRNLEVEEKLIMQMIQRERNHHSAEELELFDKQQQQQHELQQQLPEQQGVGLQDTHLQQHLRVDQSAAQQQLSGLLQQQQQEQQQQQRETAEQALEEMDGVEREVF